MVKVLVARSNRVFNFTFIHLAGAFVPSDFSVSCSQRSEIIQNWCCISEVFCLASLSPSTIAGIASSILLFVAAIATMVCCFMCSCCYLYQRRQQRGRTLYEGKYNYFILFTVHHECTTNTYKWIQDKQRKNLYYMSYLACISMYFFVLLLSCCSCMIYHVSTSNLSWIYTVQSHKVGYISSKTQLLDCLYCWKR